ncbi:hypothetical protein ACTXMH_03315 [Psychrobacter celer]
MNNNIKTDLKTLHYNNLSQNGTNLSVNSQNSSLNDKNLSLIGPVAAMIAKLEETTRFYLFLGSQKKGCNRGDYPFLSDFLAFKNIVKQVFTTDDNKRYYRVLSKNVSGQASRYLLAFFVPDNSPASQAVTMPSSTTLRAYLSASRGHSLISIASHLLTDYDGLTLQNKRAERRICRAVTNVTESKTRHPILLSYSVALTQKTLGGYHA